MGDFDTFAQSNLTLMYKTGEWYHLTFTKTANGYICQNIKLFLFVNVLIKEEKCRKISNLQLNITANSATEHNRVTLNPALKS